LQRRLIYLSRGHDLDYGEAEDECDVFVPCPAQSRDADQNLATGCHPSAGAQQASKKRCTPELEPTARILPLSFYGSSASLIYRNARKLVRWWVNSILGGSIQ
jgi:hypothetical protein